MVSQSFKGEHPKEIRLDLSCLYGLASEVTEHHFCRNCKATKIPREGNETPISQSEEHQNHMEEHILLDMLENTMCHKCKPKTN